MIGGIINVITRKGDLGSIDLPASGLLVRYKLLNQDSGLVKGMLSDESRMPDARNTLLWDPSVDLSPGESREIELSIPDQKGNFQVWIRAYAANGQYLEKILPFSVD